jgi:hypothetical protein
VLLALLEGVTAGPALRRDQQAHLGQVHVVIEAGATEIVLAATAAIRAGAVIEALVAGGADLGRGGLDAARRVSGGGHGPVTRLGAQLATEDIVENGGVVTGDEALRISASCDRYYEVGVGHESGSVC